jgi:hypothetical protein
MLPAKTVSWIAVVLAITALPAAAAAPTDTVTMLSDPGDYIGGGVARMYFSDNASITLSGDAEYLTVHVSGGNMGDSFQLVFAAPPGEDLHPGYYPDAQRAPFREFGHPGIDIFGDGRGCNEIGGRFDVKAIGVRPDRSVSLLWLTYEQHCENGKEALFGEVRLAVPTTPGDLLLMNRYLWWPDIDLGAAGTAVPVWAVNVGSTNLSITGTRVAGLNKDDFDIRLDQCSGTTLMPGEFCPIFMRFVPAAAGPRVAQLDVRTDNGIHRSTFLDGSGLGGRTRLVMHSDPGDYIGQGLDYDYTPDNAILTASGTPNVLHATIDGSDGSDWSVDFAAPPGDILAPGQYLDAKRYPFNGNSPGLDFFGNGRGCNTLTGMFEVSVIAFAPDESPEYFGIRFEQHCEGLDPALHGILEYRVPTGDTMPPDPIADLVVSRSGGRADVSWTNPGDADLAFVLVRYLQGGAAPGAPNGSFYAYAGTGASARISGLAPARSLVVAVWAVDTSGNVSARVVGSAE